MYTGEMVSVSEQQLIDCDHAKPFEDLGCEGGDFTGEWRFACVLAKPLPCVSMQHDARLVSMRMNLEAMICHAMMSAALHHWAGNLLPK